MCVHSLFYRVYNKSTQLSMPTKDTKTITIRVPKPDYYKWLKLAAESQVPISTYLKQLLTENKAEKGALIPESAGDTRKTLTDNFLLLKVGKDAIKDIRDKSFYVKDGDVYIAKFNALNHKWILERYNGCYGGYYEHFIFTEVKGKYSSWSYLTENKQYEDINFPRTVKLKYKISNKGNFPPSFELERLDE